MPIPTFTGLPPDPDFNDIVKKINRLVQELQNLLLSLDTLNVVTLNAEVIEAGTITADKIGAGAITTEKLDALAVTAAKIAANTITADKMSVSQLSAIAANLGTITAGIIYGAFIATANGTYPRIEFSSASNLLQAMGSATEILKIYVSGGIPILRLTDSTQATDLEQVAGRFKIISSSHIDINALSANVYINGVDIIAEVNNKADSFSGYTGSVTVGDGAGGTKQLNFNNGIFVGVT